MKLILVTKRTTIASLCSAVASIALICVNAAAEVAPDDVARLADAIAADIERVEVPGLQIGYQQNLDSLGDADSLKEQARVLASYKPQINAIDPDQLPTCKRIELSKIEYIVDHGVRRAELGLEYLNAGLDKAPEGGLNAIPNGKAWYVYFLSAWLTSDISPEDVFDFGMTEIAEANSQFDAIQKEMGFEDDDAALAAFLESPDFFADDDAEIIAGYETIQTTVRQNLSNLFSSDYGVALAKIEKSDRGASFPVPGYYGIANGTFFYNVLSEKYDRRDMEWLFLHEATPGHHFMFTAGQGSACKSVLPDIPLYAYLEGWAAYVEIYGRELGLYQSLPSELAAASWNMVRSARVALDIGINYYGWSDEEAHKFWRENVRLNDDIAQREIDRMRRWPAQVVTYKYGADMFERMRARMQEALGDGFDLKAYHDLALSHGAMTVGAFEDLVKATIEQHSGPTD